MALVPWDLYRLILHDVLLNNSFSCVHSYCLLFRFFVDVCLWDKTIVAWNVGRYFGGSHCQLIRFVGLLLRFSIEHRSWIVTELANSVLEFCKVAASARAVSLAIDAPKWAP
jgi:hypothetical protein